MEPNLIKVSCVELLHVMIQSPLYGVHLYSVWQLLLCVRVSSAAENKPIWMHAEEREEMSKVRPYSTSQEPKTRILGVIQLQ